MKKIFNFVNTNNNILNNAFYYYSLDLFILLFE